MAFEEVSQGGDIATLEVNDSIEGVLKEVREGQFGPVYDIETKDGLKTIFSKTIMQTKMSSVKPGEKVRITRLEDLKTGTGRIAQNFKVEVDR